MILARNQTNKEIKSWNSTVTMTDADVDTTMESPATSYEDDPRELRAASELTRIVIANSE